MKPQKQKSFYYLVTVFFITAVLSIAVFAQDPPAEENTENPATTTEEQPSDIGGWRFTDYKPYISSLEDLKKLSKEYSENILRQSIDEYSKGMDIIQDMESNIERLNTMYENNKNLNERWYWQEIDRKNQQKRRIALLKYESKLKSVTHFTRSINLMDQVRNPDVLKDEKFINFKIKLYQAYVSSQYDIHNLKPCIPVLERYIKINDKAKKDIWAYRYLASCYGYMENIMKRYKNSSGDVKSIEFKQKKNKALLTAAELQYGIDSTEYKHLKEGVELDEKKSYQLNDFK